MIESKLYSLERNPHWDMLEPLYRSGVQPTVISFNYDLIADNTMMSLAEYTGRGFPSYECAIATEAYRRHVGEGFRFGTMLKPHGSMNWMYCPVCGRLDLYYSERALRFAKALDQFYNETRADDPYRCKGTPCRDTLCPGRIRPTMITPTQRKHYENQHLRRTWDNALKALNEADRVIIIGYSMPTDDVEVIGLLTDGLTAIDRNKVTVVQYSNPPLSIEQHDAGRRYKQFLGEVEWHCNGFSEWVINSWRAETGV